MIGDNGIQIFDDDSEAIKLMKTKFQECLSIMYRKEPKYGTKVSTLERFQKEADFLGISKETDCLVLFMKHISTIVNGVKAKESKEPNFPFKEIKKSCTDAINYIVLFETMFFMEE